MRVTHTDTSSAEKQFGAQVREAREVRGWSQEALARHLRESTGIELHQTAVARLERGERTIRFNEVIALAKLLGLDLQAYSAGVPQLTPEEYDQARQSLEGLREQERLARDVLVRVRVKSADEEQEAERDVALLVDRRKRTEAAIRAYEERQRG